MKLNKLFALVLACVAFTACSNDKDDLDGGNAQNTTKSIAVKIGFPKSNQLRSLDTQSQAGKYAPINTLQLIIADGSGKIYVNETISKDLLTDLSSKQGTENEAVYTKVYTGLPVTATVVYAVANLPAKDESDADVNLSKYTNLNTLKNKADIITFENQNTVINAGNVVLQGEKAAVADAADLTKYTADVVLIPVVSRIELGSIALSSDPNNVISSFEVEAVYLNSYFGGLSLFPALTGDNIYNAKVVGGTTQSELDAVPGASIFKTSVDGTLPTTSNQIVAYNFFPSQMPHLLIKISKITYKEDSGILGIPNDGWITVQKYSKDGVEFSGPTSAGEVYTIDGLTFSLTNIGPNPYDKTISVTAKIQVKPWTSVSLQPIL